MRFLKALGFGVVFYIVAFIVVHMLLPFGPIGSLLSWVAFIGGAVWGWRRGVSTIVSRKTSSVLSMVGAKEEGNGVYSYSHPDGSIAINPATKQLALIDGKNRKTYSFGDVRKWEISLNEPGADRLYGNHGLGAISQVAIQNIHATKKAKMNSGLFITVRDVDNPVWRIHMLDKKQQQRWMEILRQTINND